MAFEEAEEARENSRAAAADRRDLWCSVCVHAIRGGDYKTAIQAADAVLCNFDSRFPEVAEAAGVDGDDDFAEDDE